MNAVMWSRIEAVASHVAAVSHSASQFPVVSPAIAIVEFECCRREESEN